jgi:1,4-alpha-glucan branching enzyme
VPRENYRIGVPDLSQYQVVLNSDSRFYGGSNVGNYAVLDVDNIPWSNRPYSISVNLPPLSGLVLQKAVI